MSEGRTESNPVDQQSTIVLVQDDPACRDWVEKQHFTKAQVVDIVRIDRLLPLNSLCVVYANPNRVRVVKGQTEEVPVKITRPVKVSEHWDEAAEGGGLVRVSPLLNAIAPQCVPAVFKIADGKARVLGC
jgi:hypothetical protein